MKIDVYDSFASSCRGNLMHFDVFVGSETRAEQALKYGQQWLNTIGEPATNLKQSRCNYCHTEIANPDVAKQIKKQGFYILQMEGCPEPYQHHVIKQSTAK